MYFFAGWLTDRGIPKCPCKLLIFQFNGIVSAFVGRSVPPFCGPSLAEHKAKGKGNTIFSSVCLGNNRKWGHPCPLMPDSWNSKNGRTSTVSLMLSLSIHKFLENVSSIWWGITISSILWGVSKSHYTPLDGRGFQDAVQHSKITRLFNTPVAMKPPCSEAVLNGSGYESGHYSCGKALFIREINLYSYEVFILERSRHSPLWCNEPQCHQHVTV